MKPALLLLWLSGGALSAQEPVPAPAPAPKPAPVDPDAARRGEELLRAHAAKSRGLQVLVATYEQTRTTRLSKQPLTSRGQFLFVREPACVVFRATAPRESIVRLRPALYEVFRPAQKRLERFHLDGPELAEGLFAALGGDADLLLREFVVTTCGPDPAAADRTLVVLLPRHDAVRERLTELRLSLRTDGGQLAVVAYRDPAGDLVEIALRDLEQNPSARPSAEFEVPKDTTVVEHAAPRRGA